MGERSVGGIEMKLSYEEKIELQYLYLKGYRYLSKNENGTATVHKRKPKWHKWRNTYGHWNVEYPITDFSLDRKTELSNYDFLSHEDEPLLIEDLIKEFIEP